MLFHILQINHRFCLKGHLYVSGNFLTSLFKGTNCYMQRHKSMELLNTRKNAQRLVCKNQLPADSQNFMNY